MKFKSLINYILVFCFIFISSVNICRAQGIETNIRTELEGVPVEDQLFQDNLGDYITPGIELLMVLGALICLFMIIASAITWMTSSGDKGKIEEASKRITAAVVGLAILACSWLIWNLVVDFLGLQGISGEGNLLNIIPRSE